MEVRLLSSQDVVETDFFTQSSLWEGILVQEGKKVERLGVFVQKALVAVAQVVYTRLPFGLQYAFCPKGPVMILPRQEAKGQAKEVLSALAAYLKTKDCLFFRFEPGDTSFQFDSSFLVLRSIDINPRTTTILDLTSSEEQLLAGMHPKTRYNIRLAEKKDLRVVEHKDYAVFMALMKKTGARDGFGLHSGEHYKAILAAPRTIQLTVFSEEIPLATALCIGSGKVFTYVFGASDHDYRALMAPYLLQWQGIKLGKKLGYTQYDFFGIAPSLASGLSEAPAGKLENAAVSDYKYDLKHQYAGVTRFKLGFGGRVVESPGTFDLILQPTKYRIYQLLRKLRRLF